MYSTIASLHIALDTRLQQLNSNRKQSIHPEQYDMALNDAIDTLLKNRLSPKLNSKQEGFEDSIKRYSDLENLKRTHKSILYYDNGYYSFRIPTLCYQPISLKGFVKYNRFGLSFTSINKTEYCTSLDFSSTNFNEPVILRIQNNNIATELEFDLSSVTKSERSLFYTINHIKTILEEDYNLDCYISRYRDYYKNNSLIIVTNAQSRRVYDSENVTSFIFNYNVILDEIISKYESIGNVKIELTSSSNIDEINGDIYLSKNLHLYPKYYIENGFGKITISNKFKVNDIILTYIKKPIYVNSVLNVMTDINITDELLDIATTNLSGILKDPTYQINKQKEQFNN